MEKKLQDAYRQINTDQFPNQLTITMDDDPSKSLVYEKVQWDIDGSTQGLRYGENPEQQAGMYRLVKGAIHLGDVSTIEPGKWLVSDLELLQSGKHPGKINITDVDAALHILRYLKGSIASVIIKHNNPCGAALGKTLAESYSKAYYADRIAAFGGAVVCNRPIDKETAQLMTESYLEVVAAPDFEPGALELLKTKKNLRIMKIKAMDRLESFANDRVLDIKSLIDGGMILQWSFTPIAQGPDEFLPAKTEYKGKIYEVLAKPTQQQLDDMFFGWMVEAGVTSNSVLYVKDGVTVGIGTGEQDRVGVAEIARDKAYRKYADRLSWHETATPFALVTDEAYKQDLLSRTTQAKGGLIDSVMISDAFFPFRDGAEVGLREGVKAILQPGGSLRDFETIEACNQYGATMMYTGQRSFRH
jgi:phosphoribosylaminoimidazolecarboxamide formyltransferase/IMP cyclohydrolase